MSKTKTDLDGLLKEADEHIDDTEPALKTAGWVALRDAVLLIQENEERWELLYGDGRVTNKDKPNARAHEHETRSNSPDAKKSKRDERVAPPGDNPDDFDRRQKGGAKSGSTSSKTRPDARPEPNEEAAVKAKEIEDQAAKTKERK